MKFLFVLILTLFLFACTSSKQTYWCGDHACINNKEKESYFKKTMIVEVRNLEKRKSTETDLEIIKKQAGIEDKNKVEDVEKLEEKTALNEKELIEKVRIDKNRRIDKQKQLAKQTRLEEKRRIKEEKKFLKKNNSKEDKIILDVGVASLKISSTKFDELMDNIRKKNIVKSYPDINNIPE